MSIADTSKALTTWDYTLEALDPPIRLATFHVQPITSLAARRNQPENFSSNPPHVDVQAVTII